MNLKELKKLAEAHQHIRYYTESPELKEDVEYFTAFSPKTVLKLISALEKYEEALKTAREYLSTINDCAKHCDPSCNWHTPECGMEQSFYKALTQVQKIMEGK